MWCRKTQYGLRTPLVRSRRARKSRQGRGAPYIEEFRPGAQNTNGRRWTDGGVCKRRQAANGCFSGYKKKNLKMFWKALNWVWFQDIDYSWYYIPNWLINRNLNNSYQTIVWLLWNDVVHWCPISPEMTRTSQKQTRTLKIWLKLVKWLMTIY